MLNSVLFRTPSPPQEGWEPVATRDLHPFPQSQPEGRRKVGLQERLRQCWGTWGNPNHPPNRMEAGGRAGQALWQAGLGQVG